MRKNSIYVVGFFVLLFVGLLAGCTNAATPEISTQTALPTITRLPASTHTVTPPPSLTPSPEVFTPTASATWTQLPVTDTPTPTAIFPNPLKSLDPGLYITYWLENNWYVQGLDDSSPTLFLPFESDTPIMRLSPDRTKVAFINASHQVAVYDLETGVTKAYPNSSANLTNTIVWSPDGQTLLYDGSPMRYPDFMAYYAIYAIRLRENKTVMLLDWNGKLDYGAHAPSWSPDGRWISFYEKRLGDYYSISFRPQFLAASCIEEPSTCEDAIMDIEDIYGFWGDSKRWLPDGSLAYTCKVDGKFGMCTINLDVPDSAHWLMDLSGFEDVDLNSWIPESNFFTCSLLNVVEGASYYDICIARIDSRQVINLTNTPDISEYSHGLSPDNQYVLFERINGLTAEPDENSSWYYYGDIYIVPVEGGEPIPVPNIQKERIESVRWLAIPNDFQPGNVYAITRMGDNLNLRSLPSLQGSIVSKLREGDQVTILEGPIEADGYVWWKMRAANGLEGWAVDVVGWYELAE